MVRRRGSQAWFVVALSGYFCVFAASHNRPVRHIIDVTKSPYRAIGDGKTDTTNALQNAINACPSGGTILFPSGTYKISSTLTFKSNCTYKGQSASTTVLLGYTGTGPQGFNLAYTNNGQNITVTGLTLNGGGWSMDGNSSNITITNNTITNILNSNSDFVSTAGVYLGYLATNVTITNNTFSNILRANTATGGDEQPHSGVQMNYANGVHVNNNTFDRVNEGIHKTPIQGPAGMTQNDNQFNGNVFTHIHRAPIELQGWPTTNTQVKNNRMSQYLAAYWATYGISFAMGDTGAVIQGNIMDASVPIAPNGAFYPYCIEVAGTNVLVDSNVCRTAGTDRVTTQWGTPIGMGPYTSGTIFSNNVFCGPQPWTGENNSGPPYPRWIQFEQVDYPNSYQQKMTEYNNSTATACPPL